MAAWKRAAVKPDEEDPRRKKNHLSFTIYEFPKVFESEASSYYYFMTCTEFTFFRYSLKLVWSNKFSYIYETTPVVKYRLKTNSKL